MADADDYADKPFGEVLLDVAQAQIEVGHYGVAVVIAQTVIEASVEHAFGFLFHLNIPRSQETMRALLPDCTFRRPASRKLWRELTNDDIREPRDEWNAYNRHLDRRNRAAHGGILYGWLPSEDVTREEAEASIEAVRNMRAHIDRVIGTQIDEIVAAREQGNEDQWRALRFLRPRPVESPQSEESNTVKAERAEDEP